MNDQTELGDFIDSERRKRGWSLRDAEDHTGVSHSMFSLVINAKTNPSKETLTLIARGLGIPVDILLRKAGIIGPGELTDDELALLDAYRKIPDEGGRRLAKTMIDGIVTDRKSR